MMMLENMRRLTNYSFPPAYFNQDILAFILKTASVYGSAGFPPSLEKMLDRFHTCVKHASHNTNHPALWSAELCCPANIEAEKDNLPYYIKFIIYKYHHYQMNAVLEGSITLKDIYPIEVHKSLVSLGSEVDGSVKALWCEFLPVIRALCFKLQGKEPEELQAIYESYSGESPQLDIVTDTLRLQRLSRYGFLGASRLDMYNGREWRDRSRFSIDTPMPVTYDQVSDHRFFKIECLNYLYDEAKRGKA